MTLPNEKNPKSIYPEDILSSDQSIKPWRVAHTKSRREKTLASYLAKETIGYYLPMVQKRQPGQKRSRFSLMPLFNGYLFFKADDFERHKALRSNHIARVIDVGDEIRLIHELSQIQKILSLGTSVFPYDFIQVGQMVRIKKGPLKDIEGFIMRKNRDCRLVLSVNSIMQSVSIEIDADYVEPLHE
jgi:transcription antitermination factor NusG